MIAGNGPPPSLVLELVRYLPPGSACEAIQYDAPEMLGYDVASRILLNVSDWSQATMITAGEWGKNKVPKLQPEKRPWAEAQQRRAKNNDSEGVEIHKLFNLFAAKAAAQGR